MSEHDNCHSNGSTNVAVKVILWRNAGRGKPSGDLTSENRHTSCRRDTLGQTVQSGTGEARITDNGQPCSPVLF